MIYKLYMASKRRRDRRSVGHESPCPIALSLNLLGDKWTLLVLREFLCRGPRTFSDLLDIPEGISTNMLSARLEELDEAGVVHRLDEKTRGARYGLTERGEALRPMLRELVRWSLESIPGGRLEPPYDRLLRRRR